jgi:hypothetical protein
MTGGANDTRSRIAVRPAGAALGRRCVVVAGMHRSGTSALTRVLSLCGLRLPADLVEANAGNVRGHWESVPICQFNDRLLARMGLHWISWQAPATGQQDLPDRKALLEEAGHLLDSQFGTVGDFVLKDPRICRLIPFWRDALAGRGVTPMFLLAYRHPGAIGRSLEARNGILPAYGHLAWLRFMLDAEWETRGCSRITLAFDRLIEHRSRSIDAIAALLAEGGADTGTADRAAIDMFMDAELRHFSATEEPLAPWIEQINAIFDWWSRTEERLQDYAALDSISAALGAADKVFAGIVEPTDRIRQLEAELFSAHSLIAECERKLANHYPLRT